MSVYSTLFLPSAEFYYLLMSDPSTAPEWKAAGNAALQAGKFQEAIEAYTKVCTGCACLTQASTCLPVCQATARPRRRSDSSVDSAAAGSCSPPPCQAIELDDTDAVFFSNRSAANLSAKNFEAALADAEAAIQRKPDWSKAHGRKGAALHAMGELEQAVQAYDAGLAVAPGDAALTSAKEGAEAALARAGGMNLGALFGADMLEKLAANPATAGFLADPDFVAKLKQLQSGDTSALSTLAADPRMQTALGVLLGMPTGGAAEPFAPDPAEESRKAREAAQKKADEERKAAEEAAARAAETPEAKAARERKQAADAKKDEGNAFYKRKEFESALACYEAAMELCPEDITYRLNKTAVLAEQGQLGACLDECKEMLAYARENGVAFALVAKVYARMGSVYAKQQDFDAAIEAYEQALLESHTDRVYQALKKVKAAKAEAEATAYLDPAKAVEAKEAGNAAFKDGKFVDALELYTEAVKRDPGNAVYWLNRATTRTKLMDMDAAYEDVKHALKLDKTYAKAWARKGNIEFLRKEYHKAMESFQEGLAVDETQPECMEGLQRTMMRIQSNSASGEVDEEQIARAAADPEIQRILADPMVNQAIQDLQRSPEAAAQVMADPGMAGKINRLIASGILRTA